MMITDLSARQTSTSLTIVPQNISPEEKKPTPPLLLASPGRISLVLSHRPITTRKTWSKSGEEPYISCGFVEVSIKSESVINR